jgi:SAM-dependent methyltransferase
VKPEFAPSRLRCPTCLTDRSLRLSAQESNPDEVREGTLRCAACGAQHRVARGVGELMPHVPPHVAQEAVGLRRFAEIMHHEGWNRERVLRLPYDAGDGYWYTQAVTYEHVLRTIAPRPGAWLLDLGSNTCWASNRFAARGLNVAALDIALWELQGLHTADYFLQAGTSYFERVLGSMNELPLAAESFDYVWACQVLHHNDPKGLRATFEEAFRVLRPGGMLLVINETLKTVRDPVGVHVETVEQYEGYEHAHWSARYRWEAVRAGFVTQLIEPVYHRWFAALEPRPIRRRDWRAQLERRLHDRREIRRARLEWVNNVAGGVQFAMVAVKPARARARQPAPVIRRLTGPRRRAARSG